ncbi:HEPN domain-containing protein [Saccharibacillus brassicae]|uniref:Uncharacterized protein n=1 Tax=Saccharibacillus brassicae TaxID=2583377 RepID=A0A4Y6UU64_SACBS|nr:HEPN domain-containing protein [Saccharibacillus brassicae]QDH21222.1 hypothetical protein FFV09_10380 [Saccharibacillus brassicae]
MEKCLVVAATRSSFSFKENANYKFVIGDIKVGFKKISDERDQAFTGLKYGWIIQLELNADGIESAITLANNLIDFFLSTISLESGLETHEKKLLIVLDTSNEVKEREFRQFFYDQSFSRGDTIEVSEFTEHVGAIWLRYEGKDRDRFLRALHWFRKGLNEGDVLDQFLAFWQGVETLNPLLIEHFGCEKTGYEQIEKTCCVTGNVFYEMRTTKQGMEELVKHIGLEGEAWKQISKARNGISHGFKSLKDVQAECEYLMPKIAELLYKGILLLLNRSEKDTTLKNLSYISPLKLGEVHFIDVIIKEEDVEKLLSDYYPYFQMSMELAPQEDGYISEAKFSAKLESECVLLSLSASGRGLRMEHLSEDEG